MSNLLPYLPGSPPTQPEPLARYLPPLPSGVAAHWLKSQCPSGAWVLDPFGASPRTAVEAARAGYRVLVAANNPISRFLLEMAADPPSQDEMQAALAELASARKGDERLEPHIRALYRTECGSCGREVMAEAFLWDRGAAAPYARIYHCPHCGEGGEHPTNNADLERAAHFSTGGLHRARALERVVQRADPDRSHVEEALAVYLPRAVYALFTLINKLDGLSVTHHRRRCLEALIISAFDQANTLWSSPAGRARPKQLTIPPRFRENNVWLALEEAVHTWANGEPPVSISIWPDLPAGESGICIFEGRLKDLGEQISGSRTLQPEATPHLEASVVLAALPRPNQAFWTLSALWAGWLWGPEAVGPFKSVLRRRRYDWGWHSTALHSALENMAPLLNPDTPFFGLIGEVEPSFLAAALVAAETAGYELEGLALRAESSQAQMIWHCTHPGSQQDPPDGPIQAEISSLASQAAQEYLRQRGEPASFLQLQAAALVALVRSGRLAQPLPEAPTRSPVETLSAVNSGLEEAFSYRMGFLRYGGSDKSPEVGRWWLREPGKAPAHATGPAMESPLADRIEIALVRRLIKNPGTTLLELDQVLCTAFTGLLTPSQELIQVCLESYGVQDPPASGRWQIRLEDLPRKRRTDLISIASLLRQIAARLDYKTEGRSPMIWRDSAGEVQYICYTIASAVVGEIALALDQPLRHVLVVLPGGRANLLAYKLNANPFLNQIVEAGWRFIKFRQLRWLAENPSLNAELFSQQLDLDNLTYTAPQMRLL